jgi:hypothetical protein
MNEPKPMSIVINIIAQVEVKVIVIGVKAVAVEVRAKVAEVEADEVKATVGKDQGKLGWK